MFFSRVLKVNKFIVNQNKVELQEYSNGREVNSQIFLYVDTQVIGLM